MSSSSKNAAYSGKTMALLRAGTDAAEKAAGAKKKPEVYKDGEDRAPLTLNKLSYVARSRMEEPFALTNAITAAAPVAAILPDLTYVTDPRAAVAAARAHQHAAMTDMIQREAGREALRRHLLDRETVEWRREQMEGTFLSERLTAQEVLRQTRASYEAALAKLKAKAEREEAAATRLADIYASREAAKEEAREKAWEQQQR